ncbi:MAG: exopolysaccharide biosynthesis polyprenyl glycosylphosphotransferase [Elusimicrobia bacterium]|nr:exopolysaccharide biosynthesis polyprenyl glycosylphosphotransferase [Elusimicrobiota bacterium]
MTKESAALKPGLPPWLRHALREAVHVALGGAAVAAAYWLAYLTRFQCPFLASRLPFSPGDLARHAELYRANVWAAVLLWLAVLAYSSRLYSRPWASYSDRVLAILKGAVLATALALLAAYVYNRTAFSRLMLVLALPWAALLLCAAEWLVALWDRGLSRLESARPVLLIGQGQLAELIRARIQSRHPGAQVDERGELPESAELSALLSAKPYLEVILLRSGLPHERVLSAAEACEASGVGFKMIPDVLEVRLGEVQMDESLGLPAYRIEHLSLSRANFMAKRAFDVAFSLLVLLLLSPVLLLCALFIKLDSAGPVLYRQKRYGYKGRTFEVFKFRTMAANAESRVGEIKAAGQDGGAFLKAKSDPRVTRTGQWLRRLSLDEFPQFLNVLAGDMSVVGPRPLALSSGEAEKLQETFGETAKKRLNALPGITGLWQVSGRSNVSDEQRFAMDLFYIERWSLGLDLRIILKTPYAVLFGKGAY